jgi:hypothetical protein
VQEDDDESFISSVFGKEPLTGNNVKRILDEASDDDSSDEDNKIKRTKIMMAKPANPTDLLAVKPNTSKETPTETWQKSIGSLGGGIGSLKKAGLVKPKGIGIITKNGGVNAKNTTKKSASETTETVSKPAAATQSVNPLGLIGQYSDSSEESE